MASADPQPVLGPAAERAPASAGEDSLHEIRGTRGSGAVEANQLALLIREETTEGVLTSWSAALNGEAMNERNIILGGILIGAAVGGALAYLALTEQGREARTRLEDWLEQSMRELGHVSRLARQMERIVADGAQEWQRWREPMRQEHGGDLAQ